MGPLFSRQGLLIGAVAAVGLWAFMSFYTVKPEERSVELFLGEFSTVGNPGLNFAPWPFVTAEIVQVTGERTTDIGTGRNGEMDSGLMLTREGVIEPASYVNFAITSHLVVVPTFGSPHDAEGVAAIASLFPDRDTIGLPGEAVLAGGGGFHCASQQMPSLPGPN